MSTRRMAVQQLFGITGAAAAAPLFGGDKQPHMEAALEALRTAQAELRAASADKGGHKGKAMGFIKQAMDEIKAGIDFADSQSKTPAPTSQHELLRRRGMSRPQAPAHLLCIRWRNSNTRRCRAPRIRPDSQCS